MVWCSDNSILFAMAIDRNGSFLADKKQIYYYCIAVCCFYGMELSGAVVMEIFSEDFMVVADTAIAVFRFGGRTVLDTSSYDCLSDFVSCCIDWRFDVRVFVYNAKEVSA